MSADVLRVVRVLRDRGPAPFGLLRIRAGMSTAELGQALAFLEAHGLAEREDVPLPELCPSGMAMAAWRLALPRPRWHGAAA
jgi:DNA-binding HxlR family transcriptional regulator